MQVIREIIPIKDHKIKLEKEISFQAERAEIIIIPYRSNKSQKNNKLSSFFRLSPLHNLDLDIRHNKSSSRNIDL